MNKYMLLMRGSQTEFIHMTEAEQMAIIRQHVTWHNQLKEQNVLVDGNGFSNLTIKLSMENEELVVKPEPYAGTAEELSGYYILRAESDEEILRLAKQCPALAHGESVEIIPLGH